VYPFDRNICNDLDDAGVRTAEDEVTDNQTPSAGIDSHMRKSGRMYHFLFAGCKKRNNARNEILALSLLKNDLEKN